MKRINLIIRSVIMIALTVFTFSSCVKKDYDDISTANVDPNLTPTHTIQQFQQLLVGTAPMLITDDVIIAGVVAGDDLTGNIYKKLILQQDLSGVDIQIDVSNFNTEYPTGRRVFVKCKGLYLANNGGNFELSATSATPNGGRIPAGQIAQYLVKGKWGQYITPKTYTFNDPNIPTNTLVRFDNVQFDAGYTGVAYAATSPGNLNMVDCDTNILILYSSTYATFALAKTPYGKGTITGVYTTYGGAGELQIRDTNDVNMKGPRCDGSSGIPVLISIDSLRSLGPVSGQITLPGSLKIRGTVTSNYSTNMLNNQNIYVQDDTTGILIRFDAAHTFAVGTKLEINISGVVIEIYNGVLQLYNVPLGSASVIGAGLITPRITTISEIISNYNTREATLVTIPGVTITGTGTYNGNLGTNTLTDATGTISLYTSSSATFKSIAYPTGTVSVTGILTQFNGTQEILIRDTLDVHP